MPVLYSVLNWITMLSESYIGIGISMLILIGVIAGQRLKGVKSRTFRANAGSTEFQMRFPCARAAHEFTRWGLAQWHPIVIRFRLPTREWKVRPAVESARSRDIGSDWKPQIRRR